MFGIDRGRLFQLVRKELRQTLRDERSKRLVFVAPIIQLLLFGYAVTTDVRNAKTFVVDHDRTTESRLLVEQLTAGGYFRVVGYGAQPADLVEALDHGDALLGLEIPRGFAADLAAGRQAPVQLLIDGTSSNTATVALGYANQIIARFEAPGHRGTGAPTAGGIEFRPRAWYNPNLLSQVYNVPGVMGTLLMLMALLLTSLAVVREREIGTLEQLMVSPLTPAELILGKTLPVVGITFVQLALIVTVALAWFGIPLRGSILLLLLASLFYLLSGLGLGLLISTVSNTQQEAFMTMFFIFFPAIILSGFMYPVENTPEAFQYLSLANPIRHYLVIVRGLFLKGAGPALLWPELLTLALMGVTVVWFAITRFHKTNA